MKVVNKTIEDRQQDVTSFAHVLECMRGTFADITAELNNVDFAAASHTPILAYLSSKPLLVPAFISRISVKLASWYYSTTVGSKSVPRSKATILARWGTDTSKDIPYDVQLGKDLDKLNIRDWCLHRKQTFGERSYASP